MQKLSERLEGEIPIELKLIRTFYFLQQKNGAKIEEIPDKK